MSTNQTHGSGPLILGTHEKAAGEPVATGSCTLVQTATVAVGTEAVGAVTKKFRLPAGSQLINMIVVVTTVWDSATTAVLKLTNAAGDIVSAIDVKTAAGVFDIEDATVNLARFLAPAASADTTLNLVWEETGATASAGAASVQLHYVQGTGL